MSCALRLVISPGQFVSIKAERKPGLLNFLSPDPSVCSLRRELTKDKDEMGALFGRSDVDGHGNRARRRRFHLDSSWRTFACLSLYKGKTGETLHE